MVEVIMRLLSGDSELAGQFAEAKRFWEEFFEDKEDWSWQDISKELPLAQIRYERIFDGERGFAKSTLAYTCLGTLYDEADGWAEAGDFPFVVAKALLRNQMSLEAKMASFDAVRLFDLGNEDKELNTMLKGGPNLFAS